MLIRKTFKFEAAHRLLNSYTERCRGVHGHSYKVELVLRGEVDPKDGMVIDFTLLKNAFGAYVDMFDHSIILYRFDPLSEHIADLNPRWIITPYHPTAENLATDFFAAAHQRFSSPSLRVLSVRVHETETGYAECRESDWDPPTPNDFSDAVRIGS